MEKVKKKKFQFWLNVNKWLIIWIMGERKNGEKIDKDRRIEESKAAEQNGDRGKNSLRVNDWKWINDLIITWRKSKWLLVRTPHWKGTRKMYCPADEKTGNKLCVFVHFVTCLIKWNSYQIEWRQEGTKGKKKNRRKEAHRGRTLKFASPDQQT